MQYGSGLAGVLALLFVSGNGGLMASQHCPFWVEPSAYATSHA